MAQPLPIFLGNGCATASEKPFHLFLQGQGGFDHGVGHPLLLLCGAKVSNYRKNKEFNDLGHYSEWPKVADAVIKAAQIEEILLDPFVQFSRSRRERFMQASKYARPREGPRSYAP